MDTKPKWKKNITEFITITVGTILVAIGVYFFKFPNHFSAGFTYSE